MPIKSADTTIMGKDRTPTLNSWRTNNGKPRQLGMTNRPLTRKMPARPSVLNVWRPLLPSLCKESSIPISLYQILGVIRRRIMEWNRAIRQAIQKLFHKGGAIALKLVRTPLPHHPAIGDDAEIVRNTHGFLHIMGHQNAG